MLPQTSSRLKSVRAVSYNVLIGPVEKKKKHKREGFEPIFPSRPSRTRPLNYIIVLLFIDVIYKLGEKKKMMNVRVYVI